MLLINFKKRNDEKSSQIAFDFPEGVGNCWEKGKLDWEAVACGSRKEFPKSLSMEGLFIF